MKNTWFSSDWHYGHTNIVKGVSRWEDKSQCRDFEMLAEHNNRLVMNINTVVKPEDDLWFVGDWSFGGIDNIVLLWDRLRCKNIHFVMGNHDHHIRNNREIPDVWSDHTFTRKLKLQELFKSVQEKYIGKICGQYMTIDHYSHRTWDKAHHGAWMLYGHSHGTLEEYGEEVKYREVTQFTLPRVMFKTMDVGIDTHPEFRPYHFDEIQTIMKDRSPLRVDHHNEKTN